MSTHHPALGGWAREAPERRSLSVVRVLAGCGEEALGLLADPRWDALVLAQSRPNPTLLGGWQLALGASIDADPFVAVVERDKRFVAGGAFALRRGRVRVASWLGGPHQSFSPDIAALPGHESAAASVIHALLGETHLFNGIARASGALVAAVRTAGAPATVRLAHDTGTWVVDLPLTAEATVERIRRKDERRAVRADVAVTDHVASEADEVAAALERLFRLHRRRWAGRPDEHARFASSAAARARHRAATAALAAAGRVRIVEVREDGTLVAAHLALAAGRGGIAHTMAMERGRGLARPGHRAYSLALDALEQAGVRVVDVGGGVLDPAGPKGRLRPRFEPFARVLVAGSGPAHAAARLALAGRALGRRLAPC